MLSSGRWLCSGTKRSKNGMALYSVKRRLSVSPSTRSSKETLRIGLAQIAPVWLKRDQTVQKVTEQVRAAAKAQCEFVVFGEILIPGYPFWLAHTGGALFNSPAQKNIYAQYLSEAVVIERGHLQPICDAARAESVHIMVGCYERAPDRGGHSGYCSLVSISAQGVIHNVHRKLVPTYEERLVWANGDGHGLKVFPVGPFTVGGLSCWENWMPLVRSALYGQGENLHVAVWPGSVGNTHDITSFIAKESRSYVASVSGLLRKEDIPADLPEHDLIMESLPSVLANGGSCIAHPDGSWLVEPVLQKEVLLTATLDLQTVFRERQNFDPSGHYSRPDVTQLHVQRARQRAVIFED